MTIADRTVGGLTSRDPMVGPWQVPVADFAVTLADHVGFRGEAMATGERMPLAAVDAPAAGRMAVGEAITNLLAAPIDLGGLKLRCNWMAACSEDRAREDAALYDTVEAVGMALCPALGIWVPVGKDSLSMRTRWTDADRHARQVTSPVCLVVSGVRHPRQRVRRVDPSAPAGRRPCCSSTSGPVMRLGGSMLAQVPVCSVTRCPTSTSPALLKSLVEAMASCARPAGVRTHDRWDCGLWAAACEMAFAGRWGWS